MMNRPIRIVAAIAVVALLSAIGAPGAQAQGPTESEVDTTVGQSQQGDRDDDDRDDDDDREEDDDREDDRSSRDGIQIRTNKTAAVVAGDTAWITVSLRAKIDAEDVRVTATLEGQPVAYPENTVDHSGPYDGYALDRHETDYVAFQITAPQIDGRKANLDLDLLVTWTDDGQARRRTGSVKVPVIAFSGEPYELVSDEIALTSADNGWVRLSLTGLAPRIEDIEVSVIDPTELDLHYPQGTYTSLLRDAVLEDGETDEANLRLGEAHWGQTIKIEVRVDYLVDAESLTRTHQVTITS